MLSYAFFHVINISVQRTFSGCQFTFTSPQKKIFFNATALVPENKQFSGDTTHEYIVKIKWNINCYAYNSSKTQEE